MFFHFQIFFQSLLFLVLLEVSSMTAVNNFFAQLFSKNAWVAFFAILLFMGYAFRTAHKISKRAVMTPIPIIFFIGSLSLLYFISSSSQQHIFIFISSGIYYFTLLSMYRLRLYEKDQTAIGIIGATALASIFIFYSSVYGIYLNFVFPLWTLMIAFLFATTLVSFQYFWLLKKDVRMVWSYSLVLGLIMTEIAWVVNFWPFGYLTTGVITLIFYYVFWDLVHNSFVGSLTKKRVAVNLIFFGLLTTLVLMSAHWLPVV